MKLTDDERSILNAAMDRYADGEAKAFEAVHDLLAPRLLAYFSRQLNDREVAQDIVQQTFLQIHAARRNYVTGSDIVPWAFAIGRNLLIDLRRRQRKQGQMRDELKEGVDFSMPVERTFVPDGMAATRELAQLARAEFARLPEPQRAAFDLVRNEGFSVIEAADALGITPTAVKLRVHRVYTALRRLFEESEPARRAFERIETKIHK